MKIKCSVCGKKFHKKGLANHKRLRHKNEQILEAAPIRSVTDYVNVKSAFSLLQSGLDELDEVRDNLRNQFEAVQEMLGY